MKRVHRLFGAWWRACGVVVVGAAVVASAGCSQKKAEEAPAKQVKPAEPEKPKLLEGQVLLTQGEMLAASCYTCHGTDGESATANDKSGIPSLKGLEAAGIEETLKEFREGKKPSTMMARHAKGYTDEQIKLIAQAVAKQSPAGKK